MYAPHFAAALVIKSRVARAPLWALLTGSFLPDLLWIVLARIGIEPAQPSNFFDDWSHSLVSILILATLWGLLFKRAGWLVALALWLSVFCHFVLDFPVHPKRLALYPLSGIHLGWDLLAWGSSPGWSGAINDWWLQLFVLLLLLLSYAWSMRAQREPANLILADSLILIGLQLLMLFPCIGY
jgi:phosphatidylglycerophosphate synthase